MRGRVVTALIILFFGNLVQAQQSCEDQLMNIKGSWQKKTDESPFPDASFPRNQFMQANNRIDKMQKLLQAAYPDPKGIEAGWYRSVSGGPLVKGGPTPYELSAFFHGYYCNGNKTGLGDETSTWFYIWVNQFNWFAEYVKYFSIKNQPVYLLTPRSGEIDGYPAYEGIHNGTSNTGTKYSRSVIITKGGQFPYVPVTRQEFLTIFLLQREQELPESLAAIEKNARVRTDAEQEAEKQKELETIEKVYTRESVERRKADFLKHYKTDKQKKEESLAQTKKSYDDETKPARDFLARNSSEELEQPVVLDFNNLLEFRQFTTAEKGGRELVRLNPGYFDARLPKYIPQLLIVYWRWEKHKPQENFRNELEAHFDFNALKDMIDK